MNLQVIAGPAGQLLWVSGPLPGSVHDMKAAWIRGVERELAAVGLPALAGKGYQGSVTAVVDRDLGFIAAGQESLGGGGSRRPNTLVTGGRRRRKAGAAAVIMPVCGKDKSGSR
jgi:hypothetical protein